MKNFSTIYEVTFEDVLEILNRWQSGSMTREEVFDFAESLYYLNTPYGFPEVPKDDRRYVLFSTLELLEMMYTNPTLEEDIPALKRYLLAGKENPVGASKELDEYWSEVDFDSRLTSSK